MSRLDGRIDTTNQMIMEDPSKARRRKPVPDMMMDPSKARRMRPPVPDMMMQAPAAPPTDALLGGLTGATADPMIAALLQMIFGSPLSATASAETVAGVAPGNIQPATRPAVNSDRMSLELLRGGGRYAR